MSRQLSFYILAIIIFSISACSVDEPNLLVDNVKRYPLVEEDLWIHFKTFEEEAQSRGYNFDLNALEITGVIEDIHEQGVAGTCQYGSHIHHVTIDRPFWQRSSYLLREYVVFHELGHCVLSRGHLEDENSRGFCLSMMNSGTSGCNSAYSTANRTYYLDELFEGED